MIVKSFPRAYLMGYNVSKTKNASAQPFYKGHRPLNQTKVKVTHHNSRNRGRRTKKHRSQNALQNEYEAWLRALSDDYEYRQHSSPLPIRRKQPWRATVQNKVSTDAFQETAFRYSHMA